MTSLPPSVIDGRTLYERVYCTRGEMENRIVNQKRVYSMIKAADLPVRPNPEAAGQEQAAKTKPRPTRPNEWRGIDSLEVSCAGASAAGRA